MVNPKINNLKVYSPSINKILREDRYDADDVTEAEMKFVMKHKTKSRVPRMDLTPGDIVVVLEGIHTGKKVIVLQQQPDFKAVVTGIYSVNGVSAFKIDERFLFKLSSRIELPQGISLDAGALHESKIHEEQKMDVEPSDAEAGLGDLLLEKISKVKYMKAYLAEPFKVDNTCEFYSLDY